MPSYSQTPYLAIEVDGLSDTVHNIEVLGTYAVAAANHFSIGSIDIPTDAYVIGEKGQRKLSVLLSEAETVQLSTSYSLADNTNSKSGRKSNAVFGR